jgi:CSLREA domain-containing protein
MRIVSRLLIASLLVAGVVAVAPAAQAAAITITVTTTQDVIAADGKCSLREAVRAASINARVSGCRAGSPTKMDTIELKEGKTYLLTIGGAPDDGSERGDLDALGRITIVGAGGTTIQQTTIDRVLDVRDNAEVVLRKVTITGGQAPHGQASPMLENGEDGGGIRTAFASTLTLVRVTVTGNLAGDGAAMTSGSSGNGGHGGGIYNDGIMTVRRSRIELNVAGSGAVSPPGGAAGLGGHGGGIANGQDGVMDVARTTVQTNFASEGGSGADGGAFIPTVGGDGGSGGGIASLNNNPNIKITSSVVTSNVAGGGGNGGNASDLGVTLDGANGGDGGHGGGIWIGDEFGEISTTTISGNSPGGGGKGGNAGAGGMGPGGSGGDGGLGGSGGGVAIEGDGNILRSTISGNGVGSGGAIGGGGAGVPVGDDGTPGDNGVGGGIAHFDGTVGLINSTLSGNVATASSGGGIYTEATLATNNVTIASNTAETGGGLFAIGAPPSLFNSIVADNTATVGPDCDGPVQSNGFNLVEDPTDCDNLEVGDLLNVDPLLGPLQDNGGPTQTHAIAKLSPARNAADPDSCEARDQRGKVRKNCDVGSYERV